MRDSAGGGRAAGAQYLIESRDASEDDVGVLHLDDALAQPHQVCADPDGTTGHLGTHTGTWGVTGETRLQHSLQVPGELFSLALQGLHQIDCRILLFPSG